MSELFDKTKVYRYYDDKGLIHLCEHTAFYGYPMEDDDDCEYIIRLTMCCNVCQQDFIIKIGVN